MKHILIIMLFIVATTTAQNNFLVKNNEVIWQKVYNDSTSITKLNLNLKSAGYIINYQDNLIEFEKQFKLDDLKHHGYKWSSFPTYTNDGSINGFIEFKENRYRVNITVVQFYDKLNTNNQNTLGYWVIKKGQINQKKHHLKVMQMLDSYFTSQFLLFKTSNDW